MPDLGLHRHIVDVLLAEHEAGAPPTVNDGDHTRLLSCIWGIYVQIHRFARAAVILTDNEMGHEAIVLIRAMLEHTVMLHWIVERGDSGVDALLANQKKRMKTWFKQADGTSFVVPPELMAEVTSGYSEVDETKAVRAFEQICKEIDARDLYAEYGLLSSFTHPTVNTSNIYCDTSKGPSVLSLKPNGDIHAANFSQIAYLLIWAARDFDQLTPDQPRAQGLERLAHKIKARPVLPPYRDVNRQGRKPGRRARNNKRRRRK